MLGDKKLRQLSRRTGLPLARAYRLDGRRCEGTVWNNDGTCTHYAIDYLTGEHEEVTSPWHWSSCPPRIEPAGPAKPVTPRSLPLELLSAAKAGAVTTVTGPIAIFGALKTSRGRVDED